MGKLMVNGKEAATSMSLASNIMYDTGEEYINPKELRVVPQYGDYLLCFGTWNGSGDPYVTTDCEIKYYDKSNVFKSDNDFKSYLGFFKKPTSLSPGYFDANANIVLMGELSDTTTTFYDEGFDKTITLPKYDNYIVVASFMSFEHGSTPATLKNASGCTFTRIGGCEYREYQYSTAYFVKPKSKTSTPIITFDDETSHAYIIGINYE